MFSLKISQQVSTGSAPERSNIAGTWSKSRITSGSGIPVMADWLHFRLDVGSVD